MGRSVSEALKLAAHAGWTSLQKLSVREVSTEPFNCTLLSLAFTIEHGIVNDEENDSLEERLRHVRSVLTVAEDESHGTRKYPLDSG